MERKDYKELQKEVIYLNTVNYVLKNENEELKNIKEEIKKELSWVEDLVDTCERVDTNAITIYKIIERNNNNE